MKTVIFTAYWQGVFRPVMVKHGACVSFDTGRVTACDRWYRCMASFKNEGETITMSRFTESGGSHGYHSSHASWTCPRDQLNAETRDIGNVTLLTPAWVDACARVYRKAVDDPAHHQASA